MHSIEAHMVTHHSKSALQITKQMNLDKTANIQNYTLNMENITDFKQHIQMPKVRYK